MDNTEKLQLKKGDYLIIFFVGLITVGLVIFLSGQKKGNQILVTVKGETTSYSIYENQEILLKGKEAKEGISNVLVIKDGKAYMKEANCPDKVCVRHKPIWKNGELIVCLPNEIFIEVENNVINEIDN